ncbi:MAG: methylated-DNA--[protein]-cysteine S-methyltransferase [Synergistaceae bacterium]|nr:methylated-DNA--[protein]-cysteine S-methyltransferase [Synergistaceae bacterium]
MTFLYARTLTPLGEMLLASDGFALCGAWFEGQKHFPVGDGSVRDGSVQDSGWTEAGEDGVLREAVRELERYFAGDLRGFSVPLAPRGTPFQKRVWACIADISYGRTESYGAIAARLRSSPRAVGTATGRNPVSLFVPCHRVVGGGGHITGYAGGLEKKKRLLTLEGVKLEREKILQESPLSPAF